jgi:hypothetical protein
MTKFKAGDIVEALDSFGGTFTKGRCYLVESVSEMFGLTYVNVKEDDRGVPNGWNPRFFRKIEKKPARNRTTTFTLGTPNVASDLRLKPQARKVLAHLLAGKSITPRKAEMVYSVGRLASRIFEIRQAGYPIKTEYMRDESDHPYGRYTLVA